MKNLFKVLMVLILMSIPIAGVAYGQNFKDSVITVMSYNIRTFGIEDNSRDLWTNRQDLFIQHIREHDPDIIGMQEVTDLQAIFIKEELSDYDYVLQNRDWIPFFTESSPVFYKKDMFTLLDSGTFWLSETPEKMSISWNSACYRICTFAVLKHNDSGKEFVHFNTHLDHKSALARENGLALIMERMSLQNHPSILTGDFNFNETDELYGLVTAKLDDTKYIAPDTMSSGSFHGFGKINIINGSPIDFIMVSKGDFVPISYKVLIEDYDGHYTSDHYAVKSVIKLK